MEKNKKHPGFKKIAEKISAREGVSKERGRAILASAARKASSKAKLANPALKKVRMKKD